MKTINSILNLRLLALLFTALVVTVSCSDDDDAAPEEENEVEVITDFTVTFTNTADATDIVTASAQDPDGAGVQELQIDDEITLAPDTEYVLTFDIQNALDPADVEDIGDEILEEDNEHQFFFGFTEGIFANLMGDGNIDTDGGAVDYNDQDENGLPVGLSTTWTTSADASAGTFRVRLQHQPDLKSATTGFSDGDTDVDLTFTLNIVE